MASSGSQMGAPRTALRRMPELAFGVRLPLTLLLTLCAIGAAQYFVIGPKLITAAVSGELERFQRDAAGLEQIYANNHYEEWEGRRAALGILEHSVIEHMGYRSDVRLARLVASDGIVAGVGMSGGLQPTYVDADGITRDVEGITVGRRIDDAHAGLIDHVVATGEPTAGPEPLEHVGSLVYHVPVQLSDFTHVLEVVTTDQVITDRQRDLNRLIVTMLAMGLVLGVPVFHFMGGRGLNRRHATAVRHSSRDALTGLGNHRAFQEQARREIEVAVRHRHPLALMLIDLDHFKVVNDNNGHRVGDEVLAEIGRILASGRPEDQAYRIGGDEFALLLPFTDLRGARATAERLREQVERTNRGVTLSIGVACIADKGSHADSLRERADVALYEAKRGGRNRVVAFDEIDDEQTIASSVSSSALQQVLAEGRMGVAFQPIWDLAEQTLLGFEALARPPADSGLSSPLEMFDAADRLGRVAEVDELCRRSILARVGDLPRDALLFINVAPATLGHELTAAERLAAAVVGAGLRPDRVVLELTERTIARQSVIAREVSHLRAMGFKIAIDDVGAGNSGLELLRTVPVDFVKIDRSVVVAALSDPGARAVLLAIVTFANETGTFVIAEGIEEGEQLSFVRDLPDRADRAAQQIRGAQGYLLGRPGELTDRLTSFGAAAVTKDLGSTGPG